MFKYSEIIFTKKNKNFLNKIWKSKFDPLFLNPQ